MAPLPQGTAAAGGGSVGGRPALDLGPPHPENLKDLERVAMQNILACGILSSRATSTVSTPAGDGVKGGPGAASGVSASGAGSSAAASMEVAAAAPVVSSMALTFDYSYHPAYPALGAKTVK